MIIGMRIVGSLTSESTKKCDDHRLSNNDLVIRQATFKMEKLDADGLGYEKGWRLLELMPFLLMKRSRTCSPFGVSR